MAWRFMGITLQVHMEGLDRPGAGEREQRKGDDCSLRQGRQDGHMVVSGRQKGKQFSIAVGITNVHPMNLATQNTQLHWLRNDYKYESSREFQNLL
eukprot:7679793-Heterocapsa_arctica.AAC.1